MARGWLVSSKEIATPAGRVVSTFFGCDEDYLAGVGVTVGDFVSFHDSDRANGDAVEIRKCTPTKQELELLSLALQNVRPASERTAPALGDRLADLVLALGLVRSPRAALKRAIAQFNTSEEDEYSFGQFLSEVPGCPGLIRFDHHVEEELVKDLERALADEPQRVRLATRKTGPAAFEVTLLLKGETMDVHKYEDSERFLRWLGGLLQSKGSSRIIYLLPGQEGGLALVAHRSLGARLRERSIVFETIQE